MSATSVFGYTNTIMRYQSGAVRLSFSGTISSLPKRATKKINIHSLKPENNLGHQQSRLKPTHFLQDIIQTRTHDNKRKGKYN